MAATRISTTKVAMECMGPYRVSGIVSRLGVPGAYIVFLFDRLTKQPLFRTISDTSGNYSFNYVAHRALGYFVIAFDHTSSPENAAIADLMTPVPMS